MTRRQFVSDDDIMWPQARCTCGAVIPVAQPGRRLAAFICGACGRYHVTTSPIAIGGGGINWPSLVETIDEAILMPPP